MRVAFGSVPREFVSETEVYDFKDPVSEVLSKVDKLGAVVVTKDGAYFGVVDDRSVALKGATKLGKNFAVGKFARRVPTLNSESELKKAIESFYSSGTKALPYVENGKIKGVVKRTEMLKALLSMHVFSNTKVNDIMSTPVISIDQEASIERAKTAMKDNSVNRVAVLNGGNFYGILSARDLMNYGMRSSSRTPEFSGGNDPHGHVGNITQRNPHTVDSGTSAESALRDFIEKDISSLPVIKNGKPVGILTIRDIFETVVKNANVEKRNIVISGLDSRTVEYRDDLIAELEALADKIDRFGNTHVDYIALNVKPIKQKEYELRIRLGISKGAVVHMYVSGYSLEATLKDLINKTYRAVKQGHGE